MLPVSYNLSRNILVVREGGRGRMEGRENVLVVEEAGGECFDGVGQGEVR